MGICPSCGHEIGSDDVFCTNCGVGQPALAMRTCSSCGYEVMLEDNFCTNCGTRYDSPQARVSSESRSRTVTTATVGDQSPVAAATNFQDPSAEAATAQGYEAARQDRKPPPGIVLKTFGGGIGNIILGVALIGSGNGSAGGIVFGVLFIALGVTTLILGGFGRKPWFDMSPVNRRIAGTGAVIGMLFLYVLFFWFVVLRWVWKYIIDPGLRS